MDDARRILGRTNVPPTDVILVGPDRRSRALIRAQLIEEGLEVEALETWPEAEKILIRRRDEPLVVVMDVAGAPDAADALARLADLMPPGRALILMGSPGPPLGAVRTTGFEILSRPLAIGDVVARTRELVARARPSRDRPPPGSPEK